MSAESTVLTSGHLRYIAERTRKDDGFLVELKGAAVAAGIPQIWISPEQASFMQVLLKSARAKEVVEVGTLAGYSAIAMARALPPGGRVRSVEIEPKHADFAESWIARSDVADRVVVLRGDGRDVLPTLEAGSADAAFIDADKPGYETYLSEALRIVRRGGLVLVDNALAFGHVLETDTQDASVRAIQAVNEVIAREPRLHGVLVPIGDGLWVCHVV
jgi:caffeoyl-CoA O-methyltransferase